MDPQIKPRLDEILRLLENLRHETEETRGYINRADIGTALRNHNDSRDEVKLLLQRWEELARLLDKR